MMNLLFGKKFLVIGAGGLLGSHLIQGILAQGAQVIAADISYLTMQARLASLDIDSDNESMSFIELDITDEVAVKEFFKECNILDGVVNAAYPRNKSYGAHFYDVTLSDFNENVALNLGSAFLVGQQCAAHFNRHKRPFSLVNIASIYGVISPNFDIYQNTPMTMPIEYAAIKSAGLHLNRYIAKYVSDSKFRVNAVSPGGIFENQPETFLDKYRQRTHGEGMLDVMSVVGSILFLLSDQSQFVTGQNIIVDDGFTL
jgi:NAD(P)-dependent dehydrogenase (short-subunit alcohol dehydrogenase family)